MCKEIYIAHPVKLFEILFSYNFIHSSRSLKFDEMSTFYLKFLKLRQFEILASYHDVVWASTMVLVVALMVIHAILGQESAKIVLSKSILDVKN